jgi:hypothetical protein
VNFHWCDELCAFDLSLKSRLCCKRQTDGRNWIVVFWVMTPCTLVCIITNKTTINIFTFLKTSNLRRWKVVVFFETVRFSETLVSTYESTRCHNPEEHQRYPHRCENLKSHIEVLIGFLYFHLLWKFCMACTFSFYFPTYVFLYGVHLLVLLPNVCNSVWRAPSRFTSQRM